MKRKRATQREMLFLLLLLALVAAALPNNTYYRNYWCRSNGAGSLLYLDDAKCQKRFPSSFDRDQTCHALHSGAMSVASRRRGGGDARARA